MASDGLCGSAVLLWMVLVLVAVGVGVESDKVGTSRRPVLGLKVRGPACVHPWSHSLLTGTYG